MKILIPFLFLSVMLFACSDSFDEENSDQKLEINDQKSTLGSDLESVIQYSNLTGQNSKYDGKSV